MKWFGVLRIDTEVVQGDWKVKLKEGMGILPCFTSEKEAKKFAGKKFKIMVFEETQE